MSLGLDKCEWLEDIERGVSSLASFISISVRGNVRSSKRDLIVKLNWPCSARM